MGVLDGRAAIVTGSARGIGRATAELLTEHGARVLINDIDGDVAEQAASEIQGETTTFAGDLTKEGVPEQLVQRAVDEFGQLDIVVNNAGFTWDGPIHKMSDEQFQAMLDIHNIVPFRVLRAAAPHMREPAKKEKEEGREVFRKIVNVSSTSGQFGNPGQANYSSGKAGVVGLTKTLAKEWGQFKINVNAVAFGFVDTRLTKSKEEAGTVEREGSQIQLGGAIEMEAGSRRSFRSVRSSDLALGTAEFDFEADVIDWGKAELSLQWESVGDKITVGEALITFAKPSKLPVYLKTGRGVVPFGISTGTTVAAKLARFFDWRSALIIAKPATSIGWHRAAFRPILALEIETSRETASLGRAPMLNPPNGSREYLGRGANCR